MALHSGDYNIFNAATTTSSLSATHEACEIEISIRFWPGMMIRRDQSGFPRMMGSMDSSMLLEHLISAPRMKAEKLVIKIKMDTKQNLTTNRLG